MGPDEVLMWAFLQNFHADQSNAAIHCSPVRFSPLTFRLAESLSQLRAGHPDVETVMADRGRYLEDAGRIAEHG